MPQVKFMAWVNRNDATDPGHLVMVMGNDVCLEYGWSDQEASNQSTNVGTPVKAGGVTFTAKDLVVTQKAVAKNMELQKAKKRKGVTRFTHVITTELVDITNEELAYLRKMAALRIAAGSYGFPKEWQVKDALGARCLSSLEDLAVQRGQKLGVGTVPDLLQKFMDMNKLGYKLNKV